MKETEREKSEFELGGGHTFNQHPKEIGKREVM